MKILKNTLKYGKARGRYIRHGLREHETGKWEDVRKLNISEKHYRANANKVVRF